MSNLDFEIRVTVWKYQHSEFCIYCKFKKKIPCTATQKKITYCEVENNPCECPGVQNRYKYICS